MHPFSRALARSVPLVALALIASAPLAAQPRTLDFEDLAYDASVGGAIQWAGGAVLTTPYAGFSWTGFRPLDLQNYQPQDVRGGGLLASGYPRGTAEFQNVLGLAFGAFSMSRSTPFRMVGGTFGSGWTDPVPLRIVGSLGGATVFTHDALLRATAGGETPTPNPMSLDLGGWLVDRVTFTPDFAAPATDPYGSAAQNAGAERYLSVYADNLQVAVIPEPATIALLAGGLAILGLGARRRRPVA